MRSAKAGRGLPMRLVKVPDAHESSSLQAFDTAMIVIEKDKQALEMRLRQAQREEGTYLRTACHFPALPCPTFCCVIFW